MKHADDIVLAIDAGYLREAPEPPRDYIGASVIGNPCDAYLAFCLRGFPNDPSSPRTRRIFLLGDAIEQLVLRDLKDQADIRVWEYDVTGNQFEFERLGGHIVAHADGLIMTDADDTIPAVLEIKSMNDKSWQQLVKSGVRLSHPAYYQQLQMLMGLGEFEDAILVAYNKNTSAYHAEIVAFDEFEWAAQEQRIGVVLTNEARRIGADATDWRCRGCFKFSACWNGEVGEAACSRCAHAFATADGDWWCDRHDRPADRLCPEYRTYTPKDRS